MVTHERRNAAEPPVERGRGLRPSGRLAALLPTSMIGSVTARRGRRDFTDHSVDYAAAMPRGTRKVDPGSTSSGALRSLVGAGPSQVGVVGALRARDVSRPTDEDVRRATEEPTARTANKTPVNKTPANKAPTNKTTSNKTTS